MILIATLPDAWSVSRLKRLTNILDPQIERYNGQVDKYINPAGRSMPTGTKRNELIKGSDSDFFCFVDCDDLVPVYYVDEMMKAIDKNPDVVTFKGYMTTDGAKRENFTIKLGSNYFDRGGHYYRWPNHLTAMKRELVQNVLFPPIHKQEDYQWSKVIHERKLLRTEVHIEQDMYHYDFIDPKKRFL